MKKKLLFVVLGITMLSAFGYAQTHRVTELGGTLMLINTSTDLLIGGGINLAPILYIGDTVGWGFYAGLMYAPAPYNKETHIIVLDTLFGPVFKIILNERFRLPIAAGAYFNYLYAIGPVYGPDEIRIREASSGFSVGAGANITAEYSLNEKIHIYGRLQGAYTFLRGGDLSITLSIGIGFYPKEM
ncbi:hypothetical protein FACS189483_02900 [Spirochaetia bacterium]|nr:hypothetical protein FACS189483_02900 [Spirochaetia bacterium]